MKYYERIRNLREDKELKQTDIAEVLGIKQQQYSRIETGVRELHLDQLEKLCLIYNCSPEYILGFIDFPKPLFEEK